MKYLFLLLARDNEIVHVVQLETKETQVLELLVLGNEREDRDRT